MMPIAFDCITSDNQKTCLFRWDIRNYIQSIYLCTYIEVCKAKKLWQVDCFISRGKSLLESWVTTFLPN